MDLIALSKTIFESTDKLAKKELMGVPLEKCDTRQLDIDEANLNEHVSIQPIAIAFWGATYKQALREYERTKRGYEMWRRSKYSDAKNAIQGKATIGDIEAELEKQNATELQIWLDKLDAMEDRADTVESWYKGWTQKAFSLKEHANLQIDEMYQTGSISVPNQGNASKESFELRKQRIRDLMNKSKEKKENSEKENGLSV